MDRDTVLRALSTSLPELEKLHVAGLWLFGSVVRGESTDESDVDLLVEFSGPVGLFHFVRLQLFLEEILHRRVDLVTRDALRPELRNQIQREALRAA